MSLAAETSRVMSVTEPALAHLVELRDAEPEGSKLGIRIEIISDTGPDFAYDLSFQTVATAALDDRIDNHGGLRLIIRARDSANLQGAVLDVEAGGLVLRNPNKPKPLVLEGLVNDDELSTRIRILLDEEINPMLDAHGGFVNYVGRDGAFDVYLSMGGGCQGCSMSRMTMVQGVQASIKEALPEVNRVVDVTDHSVGSNPYYT